LAARGGDKGAVEKIDRPQRATSLGSVAAERYGARLHRFFLRWIGPDEAPDLAQEVYMRLMRVPADEFIRNPEAYIFSTARLVALDFGRQARRQAKRISFDSDAVVQLTENPQEPNPDEPARRVSSSQLLESFLGQLPPTQAAALLLRERDGYSYAEIAQMLEVSERAVERYLVRARERLYRLVGDERKATTRKAGHE
jgi:RNA polymerase sigma-70 factor (ECF subfamily)